MKSNTLAAALLMLSACSCFAQNTFTDLSQKMGILAAPGSESIAVGDFNNDGYEDMYVGFSKYKNQLWKNNGDGTFTEIAAAAGVALEPSSNTETAVWGDIDNDGYLDLYVGNRQVPDNLFRNNGDGTFTDITAAAGIFQLGYPQSVNMADVNNDGFLDIYVSNFLLQNVFYLNNGNGTFSNKTVQSGAYDWGKAMGSIFFDYDKDGDADLYLVHDGFEPNFLYQNDGTGKFTEVGAMAGVNTKSFGMGVDVADIDNDGWLDIYITNLYKNILLRNNGDGTFTDLSASAAVDDNGMGWGTSFLDFDNDGWLDIYVANDYKFSPYPNVLYRNSGNLTFEKAETDGPVSNLQASYGVACFDFDLDGNLDIAVANRDVGEHLQLFQNADRPGNWMSLKLIGRESNRQAIGAKISLLDKLGKLHYDELTAGNGWTSQNSSLFHFGLGQADSIREMTIYWPSGLEQYIGALEAGKIYTVVEGQLPTEGISFGSVSPTKAVFSNEEFDAEIYPNPNEGQFFIKCTQSSATTVQLKITNQLGQSLFSRTCNTGQPISVQLDRPVSPQILFVSVFTENKTIVKKVILH